MLQKFIDRPILSTVIAVITLILGTIGIFTIPVSQFPEIAPPTVEVKATFPGANAKTIIESVIVPIEEQVNGVEGMKYINSTANNDGSALITIVFNQGIDPDLAAVNVQNRVSRANAVLPQEVIRNGVVVQKTQSSALLYASIASNSKAYDETFIQNYLKLNIVPELQRISGVSKVDVFSGKDYAMRIWLDPVKMTNYNVTPDEVRNAILEQSTEAAPGTLGQNSGQTFEYTLRYKGRYKDASEYENIIIRTENDGNVLYLKDVANVEMDALSYSSSASENGNPAVTFGIFQLPNTNAQAINDDILEKIKTLEKQFPEGIYFIENYNTNNFLEASISKVTKTLIEAFILVFIVVFIFLQDLRSTIIPAIAVPVSIIGAFFFLQMFGFSMNLLTLFALILGIGIVVDDAIVVVEAVHAKMEKGVSNPAEASKKAMSEISGAIISITLIMAAVFIPITFIQGPSGVFYKQFGITLVVAIFISALNALTLSPALCAIFLKPIHKDDSQKTGFINRFFIAFDTAFDSVKYRYTNSIQKLLKRKWITVLILIISGLIIWVGNTFTPKGFVPSEDQAVIFMNMELPPGASLGRTKASLEQLNQTISNFENVESFSYISGSNFFNGAGSANGMGFIVLKDWSKRTGQLSKLSDIEGALYGAASTIADANILFFAPASVPGYGTADGFEFKLIDKKAGSIEDLDANARAFLSKLNNRPEIMFASNSLNIGYPQYELDIDIAKANRIGVSNTQILNTMQSYFGGAYITDFNQFGKPYKVFIQSSPKYRKDEQDLAKIFVRTNQGEMTPITSFVTLNSISGPQQLSRFNLYNSVSVNGNVGWGHSTGDAIKAINELKKELPVNYDIEYSGITKEEINSSGQAPIILSLSILFAFFFLAAQYESFMLPLAVLLSLPIGIAGAFFFTLIAGLENNIYFQIALVMLIGLLAKNAILIVEFSKQRREEGLSIIEAAIEGAKERLRPILMTAFSFILGLMPLVFASGVGELGNRSIGTGAAGGLFVGTVIGVFFIPVLYAIFQWLHERIASKKVIKGKNMVMNSVVVLIAATTLSSCIATKTYKSPEITEDQVVFRLDSLSNNNEDITNQNWQSFFKDDILKQYIDTALTYNRDNLIAYKNIEIFKLQFKQNRWGQLPTLNTSSNVQKTKSKVPFEQNLTFYQASADFSWEADLWGKINSQKLASKAAFSKSKTAQKLLQTQLITNIATTYYKLIEADKRKLILEQTVHLRQESVNTLQSLKDAGQGNILAVNQAESQLMQANVLLNAVNYQIFTLENALISLIGKPLSHINRNSIDEQQINTGATIGIPLKALSNRPDIKEAELNFLIAFENHNVARASMYPSIKLTASFGAQGLEPSQLFKSGSITSTLIGGITAPIFNGRQLRTRKEVTQLQMEQDLLRFQQKVLEASIEVSDVLKNVEITKNNLDILTHQEALLYKSFNDSKELLKAGLANYLDVLNAQSNLLNIQLEYTNTQLVQLQNTATLYRAIGGGIN
jgi:HAE1 family hydrophobic/amphiphilic exporter-1